jgi:cation transport ATPase
MNRHDQGNGGLSSAAARRLEYAIIGLGVAALLLIFQPFDISLFTAGGVMVVVAALANNLLPLAQAGVPKRSVVKAAMIVAMTFCLVLLVSILAAYLYGLFFLKPPDPNTLTGRAQLSATPWYMHGFTWTVAIIACVLAGALVLHSRWRARSKEGTGEHRRSTSLGE